MSTSSRPAAQLDLRLSVEASADLTQQMLAAQCHIEELQAELLAQTRALAELDARYAKSTKVAAYWERRAKQAEADRDHIYSKAALTKLLLLAHPDKWSQGQPATALAHELSVAINQLREGASV